MKPTNILLLWMCDDVPSLFFFENATESDRKRLLSSNGYTVNGNDPFRSALYVSMCIEISDLLESYQEELEDDGEQLLRALKGEKLEDVFGKWFNKQIGSGPFGLRIDLIVLE